MNRNTRQKAAILEFVTETTSHPTADMIYETVKKEIPRISKGTVYRDLKVLQETGEISRLNIKGTVTRYEVSRKRHYHFRCEACGRVFDVDEPVDKDLDRRAAARTGFRIDYHQLEFRGLCNDCSTKKE